MDKSICSECGGSYPLNKDGLIQDHSRPGIDQDCAKHVGDTECLGSGWPPRKKNEADG